MNDKNFKKLIVLNLFTSANCIITQVALSITLSYIFNSSIFVFSFFTGLYLMAMGLGVLLVERFRFNRKKLVKLIFLNSLMGVLLANPGIVGAMFFNEGVHYIFRTHHLDLLICVFPLGIILTLMIGIVSGAELPIFSKLIEAENAHTSKPIIAVLTSDYFGAFLGIMIFTFVLYPFTGLIRAIFISQVVTLVCVNIIYFSGKDFRKQIKIQGFLVILSLYVIFSLIYRDHFLQLLDNISSL